MKKAITLSLLCIVFLLTACGSFDKSAPEKTKSSPTSQESVSVDNSHLQVIFDNKEEWRTFFEPTQDVSCKYAVTDMDMDGQLEIIVADVQGTGHYTYSYMFEVDKDTLSEIVDSRTEGWSREDIITDEDIPVFYDTEEDIYYYIFTDYIQAGFDSFAVTKSAWYIENSAICSKTLAFENGTRSMSEDGSVIETVIYEDDYEREITEEEYNDIENTVFSQLEKKTAHIEWVLIPSGSTDKEILDLLTKSYEGFWVK